jgi:hypothetical protein
VIAYFVDTNVFAKLLTVWDRLRNPKTGCSPVFHSPSENRLHADRPIVRG